MKSRLSKEYPRGTGLYRQMLAHALDAGVVNQQSKILVLCGGDRDKVVFENLGFEDVTISNLSKNLGPDEFAPYSSRVVDSEAMDCDDNEYDFCVAHAGLHHCQSPHRAILEMHRVSERGFVLVEPYDSLFTRVAARLGFSQTYEILSVLGKEHFQGGGLRFGGIPNYVYRFTAREIEKTVETNAPYARHRYLVKRMLQVEWSCYSRNRNPIFKLVGGLVRPFAAIAGLLPIFANNIGVVVIKPDLDEQLFPWLTRKDGKIRLNSDWLSKHYNTAKKHH